MLTRVFWLIILILATLGSVWYAHVLNKKSRLHARYEPSAFALDIEQTSQDLDRDSVSVLKAHDMAENHHDHTMTYHQLSLTITQHHALRWTIVADKAVVHEQDKNSTQLSGHVQITRAPYQQHPLAVLNTTALTIEPKAQIAHTDAPVRLAQGQMVTHATGLRCHLKTGTITLLSHVKTTIAPSSQPT